jgi:hypothetical protein
MAIGIATKVSDATTTKSDLLSGALPMRFLPWITLSILVSISNVFAEDVDLQKLARAEREQLARCMSDALAVIEKHHLGGDLTGLWDLFDATCGMEIERVKSAAENQLKDGWYKKLLPGQIILDMVEHASELYGKAPLASCSGTGCSLEEYRTCLMRQMPRTIKSRKRPIDFENQAQQGCEDTEIAARSALSNDFDNVQKRHVARGLDHKMSEVIGNIIIRTRQAVVVLYAEDLVEV